MSGAAGGNGGGGGGGGPPGINNLTGILNWCARRALLHRGCDCSRPV